MEVRPNSRNVVPGEVFFCVDLRHPEAAVLDRLEAEYNAFVARDLRSARPCACRRPASGISRRCASMPAASPRCAAPRALSGFSAREIVSGAGHDAAYVSRVAPTAMIFVPCRGGISHNEAEFTSKEQCAAGAQVLLQAVLDYDRTLGRAPRAPSLAFHMQYVCANACSRSPLAGLSSTRRSSVKLTNLQPRVPMVRPLAVRRHNEIVQRLRAAGSVSVGELANIFGVSHETIRRDLKLLADHGHLDVVHGGAARRGMMEPSIAQRGEENAEGKAAIAREAARMVADAGSVLLDSGTTTAALSLRTRRPAGPHDLHQLAQPRGHALPRVGQPRRHARRRDRQQ